MKGCTANQLPRHLDEVMWKDRHGTSRREAFNNIMTDNTHRSTDIAASTPLTFVSTSTVPAIVSTPPYSYPVYKTS